MTTKTNVKLAQQTYANACGRCGKRDSLNICPKCPTHKEFIRILKESR